MMNSARHAVAYFILDMLTEELLKNGCVKYGKKRTT